jgi:carboxylesterase
MPDPGTIMEGAQPFSAAGGPYGVLVLHGFTGSPGSVRALAGAFADAGFAVEAPLLPGHGTSIGDLLGTGWPDWVMAAEEAYRGLASACDRVVVAGLSLGGTLACRLAVTHADVAGVVCVNPMIEPAAPSFLDILRGLLAEDVTVVPGIGADIARPNGREPAYPGVPVAALLSLMEGVAELEPALGELACPLLLCTSATDHVVPPSSSDLLAARVSGPVERVALERSYHVATLDWDAEEIERRSVAFARAVTGAGRQSTTPVS